MKDYKIKAEGWFDGENMVDENGKVFMVPPNYASKSKLIEGDRLRLYTTEMSEYIFKLIEPADRRKARVKVVKAEWSREYVVSDKGIMYNVLPASGTYHELEVGDEVVVLLPVSKGRWAAVERKVDDEEKELSV